MIRMRDGGKGRYSQPIVQEPENPTRSDAAMAAYSKLPKETSFFH